jgi:hypothetical protein
VCVLQLTGVYKAREIPRAVDFIQTHFDAGEHFWYGHDYAAHAMHQVGGKDWGRWYARLSGTLLPLQKPDGSWSYASRDRASAGPVYQTAIAVICLSVPMNYLPIYQR